MLERDAEGRPTLVDTVNDAKVKTVKHQLRFTYKSPTEIRWRQEKGDVKSLDGWWTLEDLGGDRTRATYALEVDPGRDARHADPRPGRGSGARLPARQRRRRPEAHGRGADARGAPGWRVRVR